MAFLKRSNIKILYEQNIHLGLQSIRCDLDFLEHEIGDYELGNDFLTVFKCGMINDDKRDGLEEHQFQHALTEAIIPVPSVSS